MNRKLIKVFKALSDSTRLDIVKNVFELKEISCHDISLRFKLSQPTLSFHLNKLIDAGIIKVRKEGTSHIYSVNDSYFESIGFDFYKIFNN